MDALAETVQGGPALPETGLHPNHEAEVGAVTNKRRCGRVRVSCADPLGPFADKIAPKDHPFRERQTRFYVPFTALS